MITDYVDDIVDPVQAVDAIHQINLLRRNINATIRLCDRYEQYVAGYCMTNWWVGGRLIDAPENTEQ